MEGPNDTPPGGDNPESAPTKNIKRKWPKLPKLYNMKWERDPLLKSNTKK